jgi:hypothetical protein
VQFRCRMSPIPKTGIGVHRKHDFFCHRNNFFVFHNEHAQSTTLGPKLMFRVVSRDFIAARHPFQKYVSVCIQSISFCHQNHFFVFRNEHAQSTTLGPKLMFVVVWCNFIAARHPFRKRVMWVHTKHEFLTPKAFLRFLQRTCPIHYFRSGTHVWGGFAQFCCCTSPIPKMGMGCIQSMSFCHRNHFFVFSKRTCPIHNFRSKTQVWVVSHNYVTARHPFRKRVSGCIESMSFCHRNHFFVFHNEHAQSTTLGPKLILGWSCAISLPRVTHSENGYRGAYKAWVFATGQISSFFAMNMPNPLL